MKDILIQAYSYIFEEALLEEIAKVAVYKEFKADDYLIEIGDYIKTMPLLLTGAIKILREDENGDELLLYFLERGDTCAMTLQCCVRRTDSQIKATAMEPSLLLMFPSEYMQLWMDKYRSWREYILQSYHTRMLELMETIDEIAFMRLDERLIKYLTDQAKLLGNLELHHTHQQIADDLHSSRVVISRLLKQLENKGAIQIRRNRIILNEI